MKKLVFVLSFLVTTVSLAQDKNTKASIEVDGVCEMCKKRIEKACITSKGVKSANWNIDTHELQLIYDARKTNLKTIQKRIASVGHDTKEVKATDEAYNSIHACCKYRDKEIVDDHEE
ncbi:MAG TPA: heavy-metal-associated domain-containing protein [Flavobacteriaceae bacterium]|nr:heavy-metal-associated domain-containing protein [Flavobacteriaceae bacterium]